MKQECANCHITLEKDEIEIKYKNKCPMCNRFNTFVDEYIMDIRRVSSDESFIQAMVKLHDEDPIEYQLKLQQLKNAKEVKCKNNQIRKEYYINKNVPQCPICQSTDLSKISSVWKAARIGLFGIFGADDIGKTWECNNCGCKF